MSNIDNEKAYRIATRINEYHRYLAEIYESLVDGDSEKSEQDIKTLIMELRFLIKSIHDNDF